jgi:hypothetical protein
VRVIASAARPHRRRGSAESGIPTFRGKKGSWTVGSRARPRGVLPCGHRWHLGPNQPAWQVVQLAARAGATRVDVHLEDHPSGDIAARSVG